MKKKILMVLVITLFCTTLTPAMAAEKTSDLPNEHLMELAYMDSSAVVNESLRTEIIQARNELIHQESWVADGVNGYVVDANGNIIEELPQFSEIFPSDWELPSVVQETTDIPVMTRAWEPVLEKEVTLKKASGTTATPFHSMATSTSRYYLKSITTCGTKAGGTYNLGYTNKSTGDEIAWKTKLASGNGLRIDPPKNITVSIRASTYTDPGTWLMEIDADRYDL